MWFTVQRVQRIGEEDRYEVSIFTNEQARDTFNEQYGNVMFTGILSHQERLANLTSLIERLKVWAGDMAMLEQEEEHE